MKNNLLLTIALQYCKISCVMIIVSFAFMTGFFAMWHLDPYTFNDYPFFEIFRVYVSDTAFGYTITDTWITPDRSDEAPFAWSNINRLSLYFTYLQLAALMGFTFLLHKEAINIMASVKFRQSFQIENYRSFRKMGKYFFCIFCLSVFCFISSNFGNHYGFYIHLTPLIMMMGAYIMAEIFKEGNVLQEEVQNTV
jgi:hypothetical protein